MGKGMFKKSSACFACVLTLLCSVIIFLPAPSYAAETTGSTLPFINTNAILERLPSPVGNFINALKGVRNRPASNASSAAGETGEVKTNSQTIFDLLKKAASAIERIFGRSLQEIVRIVANVIVAVLEFLLGIIKRLVSRI
jgi:hypothetical protein